MNQVVNSTIIYVEYWECGSIKNRSSDYRKPTCIKSYEIHKQNTVREIMEYF